MPLSDIDADLTENADYLNDGPAEQYECPVCFRVAPWTDGTSVALGDDRDEFWCQTCGAEVPLSSCAAPSQETEHG